MYICLYICLYMVNEFLFLFSMLAKMLEWKQAMNNALIEVFSQETADEFFEIVVNHKIEKMKKIVEVTEEQAQVQNQPYRYSRFEKYSSWNLQIGFRLDLKILILLNRLVLQDLVQTYFSGLFFTLEKISSWIICYSILLMIWTIASRLKRRFNWILIVC